MAQLYKSPNAIGHHDAWVNDGTSPAATKYQAVDDTFTSAPSNADGDVDYVRTGTTVGTRQSFYPPDITSGEIDDGATINSVTIEVYARRVNPTTASINLSVSNGTTDSDGAQEGLTTSYTLKTRAMTTDPITGAAWTVATLRSWQSSGTAANRRSFGVRLASVTDTPVPRVTQVRLLIDYTPGSPDATPTPSTIAAVAAVPAPALSTGTIVAPDTVATVAAVPDVSNITTDVLVIADIIVAVANIPVMGGETDTALSVSSISTAAAVPDPTATAFALVTPETIAARASVGAPVIDIRHTFEPPVAIDLPSVAHPSEPTQNRLNYRLFRHFGARGPRGRTVIKVNGTYTTVDYPTQDQLDAADVVYLGGHVYSIAAEEAAELIAAGYGDRLS